MIAQVILELVRVVAYGGVGALGGFWAGLIVSDRHRVLTEVMAVSAQDPPARRRRLRTDTLQVVTVVVVMVAMLLTGLTWLRSSQVEARQQRQSCEVLAEVSTTLRKRTLVYLEAARDNQQVWHDLRADLVKLGAKPRAPIVTSIDRYLGSQDRYLRHLEANPYPTANGRDC